MWLNPLKRSPLFTLYYKVFCNAIIFKLSTHLRLFGVAMPLKINYYYSSKYQRAKIFRQIVCYNLETRSCMDWAFAHNPRKRLAQVRPALCFICTFTMRRGIQSIHENKKLADKCILKQKNIIQRGSVYHSSLCLVGTFINSLLCLELVPKEIHPPL